MLQVLRRCGGSVKLVDVSSELSQLIRQPGLKRWKVCVCCDQLTIYLLSQNFEENICNINEQICSLPIHPKVLVCISSLRILLETMPSYIM